MRWLVSIVLLWSLQSPQAPKTSANTVVDAKTHAPVAFAQVLFARTDAPLTQSIVVKTDERGQFVTTSVPPGAYRVFAEHEAFMRGAWAEVVSITAGQPVTGLSITLTPTAVIAGRITTQTGDPAVKVYVRAHRMTAAGPAVEVIAEARTNNLGDYRLFGLEPGSYVVSAEPYTAPSIGVVQLPPGARPATTPPAPSYIVPTPPCPDCRGEGRGMQAMSQLLGTGAFIDPRALTGHTYPRMYFPGTMDATEAKAIAAGAGARLDNVDIRLVLK
jgi:hypothetical protein